MMATRALMTLFVVGALAMAGCSSQSSSAAPTGRVAITAEIPSQPFPAHDTAYASLSPEMKRLWADLTLTVVPGRQVLRGIPATPKVRNMTGGNVDDPTAQFWGTALMRRQRLVQWALAQRQWGFLDWLGESATSESSPWYQASTLDAAVHLPDCAAYPTAITLWWADDIRDPAVIYDHVQTYFSEEFAGPCTVVAPGPDGTQTTDHWDTRRVLLFGGHDDDTSVLGDVWRGYLTSCRGLPDHDIQCER